jgi:hypothetical protein
VTKGSERSTTTGQFLPGNKFWEARSSHGRNPKFTKPNDLWDACKEYFEWVDNNPLFEDKLVTFQGSASHEPVAKMRAMTIAGLCLFLDISHETWIKWRNDRTDLSEVIGRAESVIKSQKFAGAAADLLNANIIARDLGLADKTELSGTDGGPIQTEDVSEMEAARRVAYLLNAADRARGKKR